MPAQQYAMERVSSRFFIPVEIPQLFESRRIPRQEFDMLPIPDNDTFPEHEFGPRCWVLVNGRTPSKRS